MSRQELDLGRLSRFSTRPRKAGDAGAPSGRKPKSGPERKSDIDEHVGFPSREPVDEAQLNIRLPRAEAARFRRLARADRYTLGAFLTLLMDGYEGPQ